MVCFRHLTKLFDSMAELRFAESEQPEEKVAIGMIAKDGEYVPFDGTNDCTGPVSLKKLPCAKSCYTHYITNTYEINSRWKCGLTNSKI